MAFRCARGCVAVQRTRTLNKYTVNGRPRMLEKVRKAVWEVVNRWKRVQPGVGLGWCDWSVKIVSSPCREAQQQDGEELASLDEAGKVDPFLRGVEAAAAYTEGVEDGEGGEGR